MRDLEVFARELRPSDILLRQSKPYGIVFAVYRHHGRVTIRLSSGLPLDLYDMDTVSVRRFA